MKYSTVKTSLILILFVFLTIPATAQYDGSYEDFYFVRSVSAQSSALGRSSVALSDNAFSIYSNSSLLVFQESYVASYSFSAPFYVVEDASYKFFGIGGRIINNFFIGISHLDYDTGLSFRQGLTTLALAYQVKKSASLGINIQRFNIWYGIIFDDTAPEVTKIRSSEHYLDLTSSYIVPIQLQFADEVSLLIGFTFENVFQQSIDYNKSWISLDTELPSIITFGVNNKWSWNNLSDFFLMKNISLNLLAEYQEILRYKYRTRFSLGSQLGLNDYLKLRVGYFTQNINEYIPSTNEYSLSDFTFGVGANIPLSKFINLNKKLILSIDFTTRQRPLYTNRVWRNSGTFSTVNASLKADI